MLPAGFGTVGQLEELVQVRVRQGLGVQPGAGNRQQLDFGFDDDAGQPQAAHRRCKPVRVDGGAAVDRFAVGTQQPDLPHVVAERPPQMVILAMHVIGDCAPDGHHLCAGSDRQDPAARDDQPLDVSQQHTGFADQAPGPVVELKETVATGGVPEHSIRVQADIAIAAAHPVRDPGLVAGDLVGVLARLVQENDVVREAAQAPPGRNGCH